MELIRQKHKQKLRIRKAGTFKKLAVYVQVARAGSASTLRSRKNGANGNLSVTLLQSTTGWFEDTTNSDTVAVGDDYCLNVANGATGTDGPTYRGLSVDFETTTGDGLAVNGSSSAVAFTEPTDAFLTLDGRLVANTSETNRAMKVNASFTFSNISVYVTANTNTSNCVAEIRLNGFNTALSASITASSTGLFVDSTNTLNIAPGDEVLYHIGFPSVTGTQSTTLTWIAVWTQEIVGLTQVSKSQIYKYNISSRVSQSEIYRYSISSRVALARVYKYSIVTRVALARIYRYSISIRVSLPRIYRYSAIARVEQARNYIYNILERVSQPTIFSYSITARVSLTRNYLYNIIARTQLARTYLYSIIGRVSQPEIYRYSILARATLARSYRYSIAARVTSSKIYRYSISARVALARIYNYTITGRIQQAQTYLYNILLRVSQPEIYRYSISVRVALARVYRYSISLRVSSPKVFRYSISLRVALARIYQYSIVARTQLARTYLYNITGRLSVPRTFLYNISTVGRVSLTQVYHYDIIGRISAPRIYRYSLLQRVGAYSIKLPSTTGYINPGIETGLWSQAKSKFSFSFWFKPSAFGTGSFQNIINHGWQNTGSFIVYLANVGNAIAFAYRDSIAQKSTSFTLPGGLVNTWIHIVCTFDNSLVGGDGKIYINGVVSASVSADTAETMGFTGGLVIGGPSGSLLDGQVKDFRWFNNKTLTQAEVTSIYTNSPLGPHSMFFDGSNDGLNLGAPSALTNLDEGFTWTLWIYPTLAGTSYRNIIHHDYPNQGGYNIWYGGATGSTQYVEFKFNLAGTNYFQGFADGGPPNNWYFVCIRWDNATKKSYVRWGSQTSQSAARPSAQTMGLGGVCVIAGDAGGVSGGDFAGNMTDVRFFRRPLSDQEIIDIMNGKWISEPDVYIPFIEGSGTPVDKKSNIPITLINTPIWDKTSALPTAIVVNPQPDYWLKMDENVGNPVDAITGTKTGVLTGTATWISDAPQQWIGKAARYLYNLLGRVSQPEIYRYSMLERVGDRNRHCVYLDGVNDFINLGIEPTLWGATLTKFSFSIWLNPAIVGADGNSRETIHHGWATAYGWDMYFISNNKRLYFELVGATWPTRISSIYVDFTNLPPDVWYHITVVYDSTLGSQRSKIYLNAVSSAVQGTDNAGLTLSNNLSTYIGGAGPDYMGCVKDFRWFTEKALTQTEIDDIYYNRTSAPVPNYALMMNEAVGNPVDSISGTKVGILTNGPQWQDDAPPLLLGKFQKYLYDIRGLVSLARTYRYSMLQRVGAYAISFDGIDDQITIPNIGAINNLDDFTISLWIYPITSSLSSTPHIFNKLYPTNNGFILYFTSNTFFLNFRTVNNTGVGVSATTTIITNPNQWYHLMVTFVRSTGAMKIYVDGILRASATNTGLLANSVGTVADLTLNGAGGGIKWGGHVKDFRLWRSAQDAEITKIYTNDPSAPVPNYWQKMEEGTGSPIEEISGLNPMTLQNGATWIALAPNVWLGKAARYVYSIVGRISQARNYLYSIIGRASLSRNYIYSVLQRVGAQAITVDGVNQYLNCGIDSNLWSQPLTKFSFSGWFYPTADAPSNRWLVDHGGFGVHSFYLYQDNNSSGRFIFIIRNSASVAFGASVSPGTIILNRWNHIVCTYDNSLGSANMKLYLNGVQGPSTGNLTETITNTAGLTVVGITQTPFQGQVKDFRWWTTKPLTLAEVNLVYQNHPDAPTPNYWLKMDEGAGDPVDIITGTKTALRTNNASWIALAPDQWLGKAQRYLYNISIRASLTRVYQYGILSRAALARVYRYSILSKVPIPKIFRYSILGRMAAPRIYRYAILKRVAQPRIYRYNIKGLVSKLSTLLYNIIGRVELVRTYLYDIVTFPTGMIWKVTDQESDFTEKLEDMVKTFISNNWSISDPAIGTVPRIISSSTPARQAQVDNFAYDNLRSYYIRVREMESDVTTRQIRHNAYEFGTPIDIQCYSRRLTKGEAFTEINNMINELMRIFGTYEQRQMFGIEGITFDSISNMDRDHPLSSTLWSRKLRIILHYYKASVIG